MRCLPIARMWMVPACIAIVGILSAGEAAAQSDTQNQTPGYTTEGPVGVDPNYGLPTFGTPGAEVPQPVKTEPDKQAGPASSDFFSGSTEIALPRFRVPKPGATDMETPLFTTSEGLTTGDTGATTGDNTALTSDMDTTSDDASEKAMAR